MIGFLLAKMTEGGGSAGGADAALPVVEDALLADVRGEDVVRRLQMGQAAMQREMAWLRNRLEEGEGGLPAEVDLARAIREIQAGYAEVEGFARLAEAARTRLESMGVTCLMGLEDVRERLRALERAGEGN